MNIALDMMGGDFAPGETIKGVKLFLSQNSDPSVNLTLIGDIDQISPHFEASQADSQRIHVVHASEVIEMEEHPT
ncbi:MAG TPA: phosphate--acyl-ACP acyltransferase, partial [Hanamia sp.]|nr:phosphate--acyl-ACP acyltransferase [Hanamia sp.]